MSTPLSSGDALRRAVLGDLLRALPAVLVGAVAAGMVLERGAFLPLSVLAVYLGVAFAILRTLPSRLPGPGMGPANRVTLGRLVLALPLVGLLVDPTGFDVAARWWTVGVGAVALALDGVDGWVARRTGTGTEFGARFDMETDAALLVVLSGLAWRSGQVGAWVLCIGAMRYLFVAAGRVWPALTGELAPSMRRKVVCVIQGVALLVAMGPVVGRGLAVASAGLALGSLTWSFAVDARALLRAGGSQSAATAPTSASAASSSASASIAA